MGPDPLVLGRAALFEVETAEGLWPAQVLPPSARAKDPVDTLVGLLGRDEEPATHRTLAEQVIAAVQKHYPDIPSLEIDCKIAGSGEVGYTVMAGSGNCELTRGVSPTAGKLVTGPCLTQALYNLLRLIP
jgi:hypothetical protein